MWTQVIKTIRRSKRFVITSHVKPDGDALGSALALCHFLKNLGKEAIVLLSTPPGKNFTFMGNDKGIRLYSEKRDRKLIDRADAAFVVDISEWGRLGLVGEKLRQSATKVICIDHHICPNKNFNLQVIDTKAASTGELIYRLIKAMKKPLTPPIAENLYISALTDTGSFRYPNTNPLTHRMVAELLQYGVKPQEIFGKIYEQSSPERLRLMGKVLLSMKLELGGRLAWAAVTRKMVKEAGAEMDETEGFVELFRTINCVDVGIIFRESEKNKTQVSLRSKEKADVYRVAKNFGGGGHKRAAGITLDLPIAKAIPRVLREARKILNHK